MRDLDVLAQLLQERATRLEADFIRALAPLSDTIRRQRAIEQERLVAALDSERCRGLVQRLSATAPEPAADSVTLGAVTARLVRPQLRAMLRAGAGLDEASPPETLHRLRVRVKKLRYALEPLRAVGGKPARRMLRRLERVQERVGMYHDAVAATAWLRGWAAESHDASALMATGALIHSLERRIRRLRARSLKAWRRAEMDELARALLQELNSPPLRRGARPSRRSPWSPWSKPHDALYFASRSGRERTASGRRRRRAPADRPRPRESARGGGRDARVGTQVRRHPRKPPATRC